jgi:hypothetical protein
MARKDGIAQSWPERAKRLLSRNPLHIPDVNHTHPLLGDRNGRGPWLRREKRKSCRSFDNMIDD